MGGNEGLCLVGELALIVVAVIGDCKVFLVGCPLIGFMLVILVKVSSISIIFGPSEFSAESSG
jgi:hypothetical protein